MSLWDVYENSKYADFSESHLVGFDMKETDSVYSCVVESVTCKTLDEYNHLVGSFMNN